MTDGVAAGSVRARPAASVVLTRRPRPVLRFPGAYPPQADTALLTQVLQAHALVRGACVLDVCTGTGALALAASAAGAAQVTAVDVSTRSVLNARLNSRLCRANVQVLRGDLFAPVAGRKFGLVVCNPPYVPAASDRLPRHTMGRCCDGGRDGRAVLDRICAEVGPVLVDGGVLLLTHSAVVDAHLTLRRLAAAGLTASVVARGHIPFGPVMRRRSQLMAERGLIQRGQASEELVVIEARR